MLAELGFDDLATNLHVLNWLLVIGLISSHLISLLLNYLVHIVLDLVPKDVEKILQAVRALLFPAIFFLPQCLRLKIDWRLIALGLRHRMQLILFFVHAIFQMKFEQWRLHDRSLQLQVRVTLLFVE